MIRDTTETATRLRQVLARLQRKVRAASDGPLTSSQLSVLASVDRLGSPTLGEIASVERMRPASLTPVVRSLESEGLVCCVRDETDRRSSRVTVTPRGRALLTFARTQRTEFLETRLAALSGADLRRAREAVAFLESLLEGE